MYILTPELESFAIPPNGIPSNLPGVIGTHDVLEEMVRTIVAAVKPERIYLFGSVARGEATEESDIDMLIVEGEDFKNRSRWRELRRIREVLTPFPLSKDILLYSHDEMTYWQDALNHVTTHAVREGKLLYERS